MCRTHDFNAEKVAAEETAFDLSSLPRGVARAVGGDPARPVDAESVGSVAVDELRRLPRPGKRYGPHALRDEVEALERLADAPGPIEALRVEISRETERRAVGDVDGLLLALEAKERGNGTEGLLTGKHHLGRRAR